MYFVRLGQERNGRRRTIENVFLLLKSTIYVFLEESGFVLNGL